MSRREVLLRAAILLAAGGVLRLRPGRVPSAGAAARDQAAPLRPLPPAGRKGGPPVEDAIRARRTTRTFGPGPLTPEEWAQLLWAAQGITAPGGFKRAAPSAGALYPMDIYSVVGEEGVRDTSAGVYHYVPREHAVSRLAVGDSRPELARAALSQAWMAAAPVNFVVTAEYARITGKYGQRGVRYAMIEAGHIGQNLFLQAEALGLKAGIVGAFNDQEVIRVLGLPTTREPLLIMPVGRLCPADGPGRKG